MDWFTRPLGPTAPVARLFRMDGGPAGERQFRESDVQDGTSQRSADVSGRRVGLRPTAFNEKDTSGPWATRLEDIALRLEAILVGAGYGSKPSVLPDDHHGRHCKMFGELLSRRATIGGLFVVEMVAFDCGVVSIKI